MDTLARLKTVPLFASLAPDNLVRVAELATKRSYPKNSTLCRQDDVGDTLHVIDSGEAVLHQTDLRGVERPVGYLRAGDVVGEGALLLEEPHGFSAQATTDVLLLCLHKQAFDRLLDDHPEILRQLTLPRLVKERLSAPTFPWQREDEPSLLLRRRHSSFFLRTLIIPLLVMFALAVAAWVAHETPSLRNLASVALLLAAVPAAAVIWLFVDWRNDFFLVTAKRVLHREKIVLLYETWDEAPLTKIQNTNLVRGPLGKMLGYGTLQIETASVRGTMVWDHVPDPKGLQEVIGRQVSLVKSRLEQDDRDEIRRQLLGYTGRIPPPGEAPVPLPSDDGLPQRRFGLLGRLLLSRPLLKLRYEQANQITWRKHWIFLLKRTSLALPVTLVASALVIMSLFRWGESGGLALLLPSLVLWTVAVFWLWWKVEDWRNDVYILTDRLIIDVEKKPLFFAEERRQATLDMIQNISLRMPGPLSNILNYGDVLIQTAGPVGMFTFDGVSNPADVQREISRQVEEYSEMQRHREREQRKAELGTWFQVYREIEQQREPATPD